MTRPTCIYCREREADGREHYLPQCLGRFQDFEPLLNTICQNCNEDIGNNLERDFCRLSPEAVLRSGHWIKGQRRSKRIPRPSVFEPDKIGAPHIHFTAKDSNTGFEVLFKTGDEPRSVKELSQLLVLDTQDNVQQRIPIPTNITTAQQLAELFKAHDLKGKERIYVIASSGDEERVQDLFKQIGHNIAMTPRKGGRIGQQTFTAPITLNYYRALAKIGFHYALRYIPTIDGREPEFSTIRDFIKHGQGDLNQFLHQDAQTPDAEDPQGHILAARATPNHIIEARMNFFTGSKEVSSSWHLTIGENPVKEGISHASAHHFTYKVAEAGRLSGGAIRQLHVTEG